MNAPSSAADTAFSSRDFLRLIERHGLAGTWSWNLAAHEQAWSAGLYRVLGLDPNGLAPSCDLMLSLVHPEDRVAYEEATQALRVGTPIDRTFRVICPNGTMRSLAERCEVYAGEDGRPWAAVGIILDVTRREQLARVEATERRQKEALLKQARIITHTLPPSALLQDGIDLATLTGLSPDDLESVDLPPIVPEEETSWREALESGIRGGDVFTTVGTIAPSEGDRIRVQTTLVPMRDAGGRILDWISLVQPALSELCTNAVDLTENDPGIEGHQVRAARGLLDWSMADLARASNLSFSTIRRLEESTEGAAARSRQAAIAALRAAGIRFARIDGTAIAVAKV